MVWGSLRFINREDNMLIFNRSVLYGIANNITWNCNTLKTFGILSLVIPVHRRTIITPYQLHFFRAKSGALG